MDPTPIENCVFSSDMHICVILSVGVPFLAVQHVKSAVILLFNIHPPQFNNPVQNTYLGLVTCCLFLIQFSCCVQIREIVCLEWVGSSAAMLVFWHILLDPFHTVVDGLFYIFAWDDYQWCYTIVHFHWFDFGSKINIQVPY